MKQTRGYISFYETPLGRQILKREADYVRRHLGDCSRILDVGCGPGVFERELADLNIVGVDINPRMIAAAKKNSANEFISTPAGNLPFASGSFDGVFFITSLEFMDDYRKPLDEAARVLSRGGKIAALILNQQSDYFRRKSGKGGYIAKNIRHRDFGGIIECVSRGFEVNGEYFLGIEGERAFDSKDPKDAALYALEGTLK